MPEYLKITIIVLSAQGVLMSLVLATRKKIFSSPNIFLVLFVFTFSIYLLEQILYWTAFYFRYPHLLFVAVSFPSLLGPFLYFYISEHSVNRKIVPHFIPFLFLTSLVIPVYILDTVQKIEFFRNEVISSDGPSSFRYIIFEIVTIIQLAYYFYLNDRQFHVQKKHKNTTWNQRLNYIFGFFIVSWMFRFIVVAFFDFSWILLADKLLMSLMSLSILYLFIRITITSEILKTNTKYKKNLLSQIQLDQNVQVLKALMEIEELYRNRSLRLVDLASRMNLTEHQLSQVLSNRFNKNFFEFVNTYRVALAKELLINPDYERFTIEAIGQEVGFNSKSTFNEVFKRTMGKTPSEYKKSARLVDQ